MGRVFALFLLAASALSAGQQRWRFRLQPYQKAKIFVNDKKTRVRVISRDKSFALLQLRAPAARFMVRIERIGYRPTSKEIVIAPKQTPVFVLDKKGSKHKFLHYWKVGRAPKSVTFLDENRVSVPLLNARGIDIVNIHTGERKRIAPPGRWGKNTGFVESLVISKHNELWISQMFLSGIHIFHLDTLTHKKTMKLRGKWPKVLRYDEARDRVYSSNWGTHNVSIIDRAAKKELNRIKIGGTPRGSLISDDGTHLYVTQFSGARNNDLRGRVVKVNLKNKKIVKRMGVFGAKRHIVSSFFDQAFFTADMAKRVVEKFSKTDDKLIGKLKVFYNPNTIVTTSHRPFLYVSSRGRNSPRGYHYKGNHFGQIQVIDTNTLKLVESWEGGNQPTGLDISPGGKYVVSSDFLDHAIRVYEYVGE